MDTLHLATEATDLIGDLFTGHAEGPAVETLDALITERLNATTDGERTLVRFRQLPTNSITRENLIEAVAAALARDAELSGRVASMLSYLSQATEPGHRPRAIKINRSAGAGRFVAVGRHAAPDDAFSLASLGMIAAILLLGALGWWWVAVLAR